MIKRYVLILAGIAGFFATQISYAPPVGVYMGFGGVPYYNYYPYYYNYPSWYAYNYPYYYGVPYKGFHPTRYVRCKTRCKRNACVRRCR